MENIGLSARIICILTHPPVEDIGLSCLSKRLSRLQNSKLKIANGDNSKLKKEVER